METDPVPSPEKPNTRMALTDAAREIRRLRSELDKARSPSPEPVAVVSMACRLPGGVVDPESYLKLLREGRQAIRTVPPGRWDSDAWFDQEADAAGKLYTNDGGYLDAVDGFDPEPFGISPREAKGLDPQQRLLLEVTWEALERAGLPAVKLQGSNTGVYIGMSTDDYAHLSSQSFESIDAWNGLGTMRSVAAGRIAYTFGLEGPALLFDTSCSSSLAAIHQACRDLQNGTVSAAIAGGVNLILSPRTTITLCRLKALSPDGLCRTFDADANGYVRGEGCGIVILKRLDQAIQDNDRILAVIRGSAINHDGKSNGLTAPNGQVQERLMARALDNADVLPGQVQYVEVHGTGTALGDPIEVNALGSVYGPGHSRERPLRIGSVKTNIGHLEAAAGVAGFIKTVLSLQHGEFFPHLHFVTPNPHIQWGRHPLSVPVELEPWNPSESRRRAAVSAFGMSGTNVHLVMEEWDEVPAMIASRQRPFHLLTLSAQSDDALGALADRYGLLLESSSKPPIEDLCYSTNIGRSVLDRKAAFIASTQADMSAALKNWSAGPASETPATDGLAISTPSDIPIHPKIGFLFTGQGAQYQHMGRELYGSQQVFTETLDRCDDVLRPILGKSLRTLINDTPDLLNQTRYTQPVLFSLECAIYKLWESWGITPHAVMGHSLGEYVAAWAAGVFDLECGLGLIADRARLMQSMPGHGAMAAVLASEQMVHEVLSQIRGNLEVAALNGPEHVVISGDRLPVQEAAAIFESKGIGFRLLDVSHAFHSSQMDGVLPDYEAVAAGVDFRAPSIPIVSNLTGRLVHPNEMDAPYWSAHTRRTVRFEDGLRTLREAGCQLFVEIGPRPVLLGMARSIVTEPDVAWLPSLRPGTSDWKQLLASLGELYVRGVPVDFEKVDKPYAAGRCVLPTYPFQRRRFWLDKPAHQTGSLDRKEPEVIEPSLEQSIYTLEWVPTRAGLVKTPSPPITVQDAASECDGEETWLLFTDESCAGRDRAQTLKQRLRRCIEAYPGTAFEKVSDSAFRLDPLDPSHLDLLFEEISGSDLQGIVHTWNLETTSTLSSEVEDLRRAAGVGCASILHLTQTLLARAPACLPVWVVTSGAQHLLQDKTVEPAQSIVWGLGKVIGQEHPELRIRFVDIDPTEVEGSLDLVADLALGNDTFTESEVAIRGSDMFVPRVRRLPLPSSVPTTFRSDATYLITGGLGEIGIEAARWMVENGATSIVLVARSAPDDRVAHCIETWQRQDVRVEVVQADVSVTEDVERLIAFIRSNMKPLRGLIHSAGVYDDRLVVDHQWELFETVFAAKVYGTWNLHRATMDDSLDFFISYSSAASMLGAAGLANYVAANAFLDAFSSFRRAKGLSALTVCWGPWDNIGMARKVGAHRQAQWKSAGVSPLGARVYRLGLEAGLAADIARIGVFDVDWNRFVGRFLDASRAPQLHALADRSSQHQPVRSLLSELQLTEPHSRQEAIIRQTRSLVAAVLEIEEPDQLPQDKGLFQLGLDSLMALDLVNRLNQAYGCALSATAVFRHPTVTEMATHLLEDILHDLLASPDGHVPSTRSGEDAPPSSIDSSTPPENEIAVIGMACRFPGEADTPEKFWTLLSEGTDAIVPYPDSRWDVDAFFDPDPESVGKISARQGGFLDHVDQFDPEFFGISPKEAISMDPQQRMLLEVSWEVLERSGIPPSTLLKSNTGVFVGIGQNDYAQWKLNAGDLEAINAYDGTGTGLCFAAGRISHTLGLQGPSMVVDTACSSSLVSVHLACQSLLQGECSAALAGGGHLNLAPEISVFLSRTGALSPDGRCKAFDASADGFGRGEGVGMLFLKRLADARADGNPILAVIRGTATNHDGPSSGLTVPSQKAQESLLRETLRRANLCPKDIGYVEAHGTGTVLGDPIEVESLAKVYGEGRPAHRPLYIGSVKSNIGHLEPAAGIAGLMKSILSLQYGSIPKHLHFRHPNPHIAWDQISVRVASEAVEWGEDDGHRYAGISSFGMSGTNAHVILESAPPLETPSPAQETSDVLLVLSAKTRPALEDLADQCARLLDQGHVPDLVDFCTTAARGRDHHPQRLAVIGSSATDVCHKLRRTFLTTPERDTFRTGGPAAVEQKPESQPLQSIALQYVAGVDIDWPSILDRTARRPDLLPTYPFQRRRFWVEGSPFTRTADSEDEIYYGLDWEAIDFDSLHRRGEIPGTWIILADRNGVGDSVAELIRHAGLQTMCLYKDSTGPDTEAEETPTDLVSRALADVTGSVGIVYLWSADDATDDIPEETRNQCEIVLEIARHLRAEKQSDPRFWIVTRGAQANRGAEHRVGLHTAALWGLGRSLALECPDRWGGIVDIDPQDAPNDQAARLWHILGAKCPHTQFVDRGGIVSVPTVVSLPVPSPGPIDICEDATYLVSGGLGALGLQTARWLASKGACNLVLFGRRGVSKDSRAAIADLTEQGVSILAPAADVTDEEGMRALFHRIASDLPPLKGIIHAAGLPGVSPLDEISNELLRTVLEPKVNGAWILDRVSDGLDLDFFVLYSSIASVWGSKTQVHYAAANSFLDALALDRQARGLPATSVSWGPWDGPGMVTEIDRLTLIRMGIKSLSDKQVAVALDRVLGSQRLVAVADVDWSRLRTLFESAGSAALVSRVGVSSNPKVAIRSEGPSPFLQQWHFAQEGDRPALTRVLVDREARKTMGIHADEEFDPDRGFFEMGMDSMMAVDLKKHLEDLLRMELPATIAFDHPTSTRLADRVNLLLTEADAPWRRSTGSTSSNPEMAVFPSGEATRSGPDAGADAAIQDRLDRLEILLKQV